jgi:hypothetical protein
MLSFMDYSTVMGYNFSVNAMLIRVDQIGTEAPMFVIAVVICLLIFAVIAGADLFVSNLNSDELSNMGVERKS